MNLQMQMMECEDSRVVLRKRVRLLQLIRVNLLLSQTRNDLIISPTFMKNSLGTTHSGGYHHNSVVYALKDCSYRMIDTAKRYGVERQIGLAIKVKN